jgi:hypothetical protein
VGNGRSHSETVPALDRTHQAALEDDLMTLLRQNDRGGVAGLVVPAEYLETVITR